MTRFTDTQQLQVPQTEPLQTVTNVSNARVYSSHFSNGDPNGQVTGSVGDRCWDYVTVLEYFKTSGNDTNVGWVTGAGAATDTYFTGDGVNALASATAAVVVPMNSQTLTFNAAAAVTINSNAKMHLNVEGLRIDPSSGGTAGFLELPDGDSTNTITIAAPTNVTTDYTLTFPAALPTVAGQTILSVDPITGVLTYVAVDGNRVNIIRADSITGVEPTVGEIPSPVNGDTALVLLLDGTREFWAYDTAWNLTDTQTPGSVASATEGVEGISFLATTAEAVTATNTTKNVTPAGLGAKVKQERITYGNGALLEITVAHGLTTAEFSTEVELDATGEKVFPTIVSKSSVDVVIRHGFAPATDEFAVTVQAIL